MKFPAIARKTFEALRSQLAFASITDFIISHLKLLSSPIERATFVHNVVDNYNQEVFNHPLVKELSPCKSGCAGCCHTQVSITADEAELLKNKLEEGVKINFSRLVKQSKTKDDEREFYKLSYEDRKCVFLNDENQCSVYESRPLVCRTNGVLGEASQCSTVSKDYQSLSLRLVKTEKSDMAIMGAFLFTNDAGSLPHMLMRAIQKTSTNRTQKSKKSIFKDRSL